MSTTTTTTKHEFLAIVNDHPGSLQKRLSVRPTHLAALKPVVEAGDVVFGGATLTKHPQEGETPDLTGSVMLIKAETEEQVWEILRNDIYTKSGVWDLENTRIVPFKTAVRTSL